METRSRRVGIAILAAGAVLVAVPTPGEAHGLQRATLCTQTLQYGSKGSCVSSLQTRLNQLGGHLAVDGDFGPATRAAVLAFQGRDKIGFDGIVGPQTRGGLNAGSVTISSVSVATINSAINAKFGRNGPLFQKIARCESGPNEVAVNVNSNGTYDLGVLQINTTNSSANTTFRYNMLHYVTNINQAYSLFASRGTEPWNSSKSCWG